MNGKVAKRLRRKAKYEMQDERANARQYQVQKFERRNKAKGFTYVNTTLVNVNERKYYRWLKKQWKNIA